MTKFKPLITGFRATTFLKAFILNAIATSLIAFAAVVSKEFFESKIKKQYLIYLATIGFTFISAFVSYGLMFLFFGFGAGMLAAPIEIKK